MIALTFDDGPDPVWTPLLLDALAGAGARATFFPLAPRAAAYPELVERMAAEGHAVGLHGWAHLKHPESSAKAVAADTERALAAFAEPPRFWRLPYGMAAPWSVDVAAAHGLEIVGWTHDTHDWRGDTAPAMLAAALRALVPGAIVLAHDGLGPGVRRPGCGETVALVAPLVAAARSRGLEAVTVGELAGGARGPARVEPPS